MWEPISRAELDAEIARDEASWSKRQRQLFVRTAITPEKWKQSPWGDEGGGFWVVAICNGNVVWFNDIEEGFNVSRFDTPGRIPEDEYWCNHDTLGVAMHRLAERLARSMGMEETARLRDALDGRRCISAWLGHGDALFLGFGADDLPANNPGERRARPPFQLETNYAAWSVEGPIAAIWTDNESETESAALKAAAESLVGEVVVGWELLERLGLRITLSGDKTLSIAPWPRADGVADAWCLASPDGRILAVANDGRVVVVDSDSSITDWFPD